MKKILAFALIALQTAISYGQETAENFILSIEKKHNKETFMAKKYIRYTIDIAFGGKKRLEGVITQEPGGGKIKIEKKDGSLIVFDGTNVYALGIADDKLKAARFDIFTWSYFLGFPYKLNDKGTIWSDFKTNKWGNKSLSTGKLAFKSGIGDAPDDWYIVYKNPNTHLIEGAAYIVSFGKGKEKAEKDPHAIKYNDIKMVNSIPISTNWTFHNWSLKDGYTDIIGQAKLSNIEFIENAQFDIPQNAKIVNAL
ncbi:MAG: heat-shock protein Hsp90 [Tenacibaculum sp.]